MSRQPSLVFLYGTLKPGFPNAHALPSDVTCLGEATTVDRYPLVVEPRTGVPFLLPADNRAHHIKGFLYRVSASALADMDAFEGVDIAFYERRTIAVQDAHESVVIAGAYFRHPDGKGPAWVREWSLWRLRELPLKAEYTLEDASIFIKRGERS